MVHLPTYLPTYQPTRQPTGSVSPPSPPRYHSLCVRASPRDIVSPVTLSLSAPPLASSTRLVYFPLFPSSYRSPFPPLLRFTVTVLATARWSRPRRALSRLSALSVRPRATQLYSPTHSAYSPPCTQPPLVAASPVSSRLVSPRLASPRHATPRLSPFPPRPPHCSQRVASHESPRERSLIFRFVHEAARRGGYHTPRERTWTRSTKRSPDGAEQRGWLLPFLRALQSEGPRPVRTRLSCRHDTRSTRSIGPHHAGQLHDRPAATPPASVPRLITPPPTRQDNHAGSRVHPRRLYHLRHARIHEN